MIRADGLVALASTPICGEDSDTVQDFNSTAVMAASCVEVRSDPLARASLGNPADRRSVVGRRHGGGLVSVGVDLLFGRPVLRHLVRGKSSPHRPRKVAARRAALPCDKSFPATSLTRR